MIQSLLNEHIQEFDELIASNYNKGYSRKIKEFFRLLSYTNYNDTGKRQKYIDWVNAKYPSLNLLNDLKCIDDKLPILHCKI